MSGNVRFYSHNSDYWVKGGGDINVEYVHDYLGCYLEISSDVNTVTVGTFGNDGNGSRSVYVRLYVHNGNSWVRVGGDIDGESSYHLLGYSVTISIYVNILDVGANCIDRNGNLYGRVRF